MLTARINIQTSEKSKQQVSSIFLVLISFVVFCGIIFYHGWDRLLKSCLQKPITNIKDIFKKPPPPSSYNDAELPLTFYVSMCPESTGVKSKPTISLIKMRRESLLLDD